MSNTPAPNSNSASPAPQTIRHALTPQEKQRSQLERLLKDPTKLVFIPLAPKEKTIRPAREMMKNVQGSSAGAGSGEFHVYKAGRRREYERLKMMEEESKKVSLHVVFSHSAQMSSCRNRTQQSLSNGARRLKTSQKQRLQRTARNGRRRRSAYLRPSLPTSLVPAGDSLAPRARP